ncbi:hypothetical protein CF319_g4199 [Tilletia indica]|nr:hypothetical protein CF319_g4199 [Tilletia indica]
MGDPQASTSRGNQHECHLDHSVLTSRTGHQVHHFKRIYLGPSPVSASKAVSVALTLAQAEVTRKLQLEAAAPNAGASASESAPAFAPAHTPAPVPTSSSHGRYGTALEVTHELRTARSAGPLGNEPKARSRSRSRGMRAASSGTHLPRYHMSTGGSFGGASSGQIMTLEPGAIGTSAGGTKWVGSSFDVGAAFQEVAERRRERVRELERQKIEDAKRAELKAEEEAEQRRKRGSMFLVLNDHQPFSPVSPPPSALSPGPTFMGSGWLPANPITEHDEGDVPRLQVQEERNLDDQGRVADSRRPSDVLAQLRDGANRDTAVRSREASGTFDEPTKPSPTSGTPNVNFDLPDLPDKRQNGTANGSALDLPSRKPNGAANGTVPHIAIPFPSTKKGLGDSGTSTAAHSEEDILLQMANKPAPNSRAEQDPTVSRKTILKRDRMLVKEDWTAAEDVPADFDELAARKYSVHNDKWRELVVILRMRRVELWQESRVRKTKPTLKLRTSIPLYSSETHLSVYSKADNIFCLTFEPSRRRIRSGKGLVHLRRSGTNIILFNPRFSSAAADWMWEIWRELGGMIPPSIDVHVPTLDLHVRLPVPEEVPDHEAAMLTERTSTTGALLLHSSLARKHGHAEPGQEGYKLVNRQSVIGLVLQLVEAEPQLREMLDWLVAGGLQLELAWRRGTTLDWIIQDLTVEMEPRCWALLSGAMFKKPNSGPTLELRVAAHNRENIHSGTRQQMDEPPAIEGFLWRVRPVSNTLDRIYLTTHDGHVFACRPSRAFPPDRHLGGPSPSSLEMRVPRTEAYTAPGSRRMANASVEYEEQVSKRSRARRAFEIMFGRTQTMKREDEMATFRAQILDLIRFPGDSDEELDAQERIFQTWQRRRQFEQIDGADGYIDLRDIYAVRTLAEVDGMQPESLQSGRVYDMIQRDLGGEEHMSASDDKVLLRKLRQFEVVHSNGRSIRLESYSAQLTRQWITHLTDLIAYWKRKERADAITLMQIQGSIDPTKFSDKAQRALAEKNFRNPISEEERISPLLASLWNWCIVEGCRGIIRSGKLYHKRSPYAPFERGYFILVGGRLLGYALSTSERTSRASQNAGIFWRRRSEAGGMRTIPLQDAYVFSGPLTDDFRGAKSGSFEGGAKTPAGSLGSGTGAASAGRLDERHALPRVYADGMISTDDEEDCTFVIRFRKHNQGRPSATPSAVRPLRKMADRGTAAAAALFAEDDKNPIAEKLKRRATEVQDKLDGAAGATDPTVLPRLRDQSNVDFLVMRARSKLEKEVWVWAIRLEIERLVREDPERDEALRKLEALDGEAESKYRHPR